MAAEICAASAAALARVPGLTSFLEFEMKYLLAAGWRVRCRGPSTRAWSPSTSLRVLRAHSG